MSEKSRHGHTSETMLKKLVTKAVLDRNLIEEGDRILIAVSGGKDSSALACLLSAIRPALKRNYELAAIHISTDFCACCKKSVLAANLESWGIPYVDVFVPVIGRLKEGEKMNCYWCSTQRRLELIRYATENGFNKLALGHHLDDVLETFFMNMMHKGDLSAMPVHMQYRKFPLSLIRPLYLVEEKQIIEFAREKGIFKSACTCPYGRNSERRKTRSLLSQLTGDSGLVKRRILSSLSSGSRDYLLDLVDPATADAPSSEGQLRG